MIMPNISLHRLACYGSFHRNDATHATPLAKPATQILTYLPVLIGYTGGKRRQRDDVVASVGAIATMWRHRSAPTSQCSRRDGNSPFAAWAQTVDKPLDGRIHSA